MMKKYHYILFSFVLIAGVSCSKDNGGTPKQGAEVSFFSSISPFSLSKKNYEYDFPFYAGDEISVFALKNQNGNLANSGNYANNVRYVYRNGTFTAPSNPIRLPSGNVPLEYYAVCPYSAYVNNQMTFTVQNDQSTVDGYLQSDMLTAHTLKTSSQTPELSFNHCLSQVCVNLVGKGVRNQDFEVFIKAQTRADVNIQADTYKTTGNDSDVTMLYESTNNCHYAIIPPQSFAKSDHVIYLRAKTTEGWVDMYNSIALQSGKQYFIEIDVDLSLENMKAVVLDGQIRPWENSGTIGL